MSDVTLKTEGGVCWVTLSRPEQRNALTVGLLDSLLEAVEQAEADDSVRCLVITGAGRGFCAGADLAEWAEKDASGELETYGWTDKAHELMTSLAALPIPTIAAINGAAVGAGMDLALCCDFRYAASTAKFKPGYTTMAYAPDAGGSWWLPRLIGVEAAKQFLFFDEVWTSERAKNTGLVTEVYAADALIGEVSEVATRLAMGPSFAYGKIKALLEQSQRNTLSEQLEIELQVGIECGRTLDAQEALKAAVEKRTPEFVGR